MSYKSKAHLGFVATVKRNSTYQGFALSSELIPLYCRGTFDPLSRREIYFIHSTVALNGRRIITPAGRVRLKALRRRRRIRACNVL